MDILNKTLTKKQLLELSPLVLAFIGDSVHTLYVRDGVVKSSNMTANNLHKKASLKCKATHQAKVLDEILNLLTQEEQDVVRRTRNCKVNHTAKNSSLEDYKKATSYEALIGWLYLQGDYERMEKFLNY